MDKTNNFAICTYATNENIEKCCTMLTSFLLCNDRDKIDVVFIEKNLSQENKKKIHSISSRVSSLHAENISDANVPVITMALGGYNKVIYASSYMLFTKNVNELLNSDIEFGICIGKESKFDEFGNKALNDGDNVSFDLFVVGEKYMGSFKKVDEEIGPRTKTFGLFKKIIEDDDVTVLPFKYNCNFKFLATDENVNKLNDCSVINYSMTNLDECVSDLFNYNNRIVLGLWYSSNLLYSRVSKRVRDMKSNNSNVDLFIGTIKDSDTMPSSDMYKIMALGGTELKGEYNIDIVHDNEGDNISYLNKMLCEFTGMYYVAKNYPMKKYVGFTQYRKRFEHKDYFHNVDDVFKEHDAILGSPIHLKISIKEHYAMMHNVKDLDEMSAMLNEKAPQVGKLFDKLMNGKMLFTNNCFIMKQEDFLRYVDFIQKYMTMYMDRLGIKSYEDCVARVENDKEGYLKKYSPNNTVEYQARFLAYVLERLTNVFYIMNFKNPKFEKLVTVEKKY